MNDKTKVKARQHYMWKNNIIIVTEQIKLQKLQKLQNYKN